MAFKFQIEQANREQAKLRLALSGPGGAGKTKSSLRIGRALVGPEGKLALADTEFGSASKYAPAKGREADNDETFDFLRIPISGNFDPRQIPDLINFAASQGVDCLIVDSMTHFWNGVGGFLESVDAEVKRMISKGQRGDSFAAWKVVDPLYKAMIAAILGSPMHVICTLRAKTEYDKTSGGDGVKGKVTKLGMAPEMRDHFQYEMDIDAMLDMEHNLVIGKTRCSALDGKVFHRPGADVAKILRTWLDDGDAPVVKVEAPAVPALATDEQKATMKHLLNLLQVTSGAGSYIASLNHGERPTTAADFARINAELKGRVVSRPPPATTSQEQPVIDAGLVDAGLVDESRVA